VIVVLQGCVIVALQGCVIVALQGCVIVALQGCMIVVLQGCVIVPLRARLREKTLIQPYSTKPNQPTPTNLNKQILTIYITVFVTRGRHFGARESV
jgi:hypothetical protein